MMDARDELIRQADECRKLAGDIRAAANIAVECLGNAQVEEVISKVSFENQCLGMILRRLKEAIREAQAAGPKALN